MYVLISYLAILYDMASHCLYFLILSKPKTMVQYTYNDSSWVREEHTQYLEVVHSNKYYLLKK